MADQAEDLRRLAKAQRAWRELANGPEAHDRARRAVATTSKSQWADCSDFFDDAAQAGQPDRPINSGDQVP